MKLVYHRLLPVLLFIFAIGFFFLRLFYPTAGLFMIPDFGESDVLHLNFPLKYILSASLKSGQWPLWSPYLAGGFPVLAEGQIGTFYLPNLLLFRFLPLILAYNLNLIIAYILAAIGTYLFVRKIGLSFLTAVFASFVFTFSGFLAVHLNHFNLIQAVSLLPLIFWSGLLIWQKPNFKYAVLFAFILSQQIFTGHFYIVFITLISISLYLLALLTFSSSWNLEGAKKIFFFLLTTVFAFFLSAIQLFPTIELWQLSARQAGLDFNSVTDFPFPFRHLITFVVPYFFGNPKNGTYPAFSSDWGIFWENTAYIGLLPLILAAASFLFWKNKLTKTFCLLLLVSLLLVLGKNSPFYFIFSIFPFNLFRVPSKYLLLTTLSLTILSSLVFEKIFNLLAKKIPKPFLFLFAVLIFLLLSDEYKFSYTYPPVTPASLWTSPPESVKFFGPNDKITSPTSAFSWNKVFKKDGWQDFTPYVYFKNNLYPNYNALFGLKQVDVNTGGLTPRRLSLFTASIKNIDVDEDSKEASISSSLANTLSLAGVKYFISAYNINNPSFSVKNIINPPAGISLDPIIIYENKNALPRSYFAFNSKKIDTVEDFSTNLADENFLGKQTVLVEDDALKMETPAKPIKEAVLISENPTEIILEGVTNTPAILVSTDTNYPGWQASVDEKPVLIHNVNLSQKGIMFPAGKHRVKFSFKSASFELGKNITVVSFLIFSLAVFLCPFVSPRKVSDKKRH